MWCIIKEEFHKNIEKAILKHSSLPNHLSVRDQSFLHMLQQKPQMLQDVSEGRGRCEDNSY